MGQTIHVPPSSLRRTALGYTMMELIITLMIISILSALAVPAMREFGVRANVSTTTNDIVVALNMARSEAVKRGRNVVVLANGGSWTSGWSVQTDAGAVLIEHAAVAATYRVLGRGTGVGALNDRVIFTATGAIAQATGFDFSVCRPTFAPGNAQSRRVIVGATGMIRSRRDTTAAPAGTC